MGEGRREVALRGLRVRGVDEFKETSPARWMYFPSIQSRTTWRCWLKERSNVMDARVRDRSLMTSSFQVSISNFCLD